MIHPIIGPFYIISWRTADGDHWEFSRERYARIEDAQTIIGRNMLNGIVVKAEEIPGTETLGIAAKERLGS